MTEKLQENKCTQHNTPAEYVINIAYMARDVRGRVSIGVSCFETIGRLNSNKMSINRVLLNRTCVIDIFDDFHKLTFYGPNYFFD